MTKPTKTTKKLTGEDAVDIFGGDAENIVEELNEPLFHYKIEKYLGKNDGQCEEELFDNFYSYRCSRKAKESMDGAMLCGTHANSLKKWRKI